MHLDVTLVTYGVHIQSFWTEGYTGQTLNNGHALSIYVCTMSTVKLCWHNFTQSAHRPTYWLILIKRIFKKCYFWKIYIFWLISPNRGHWLCCHNFSQRLFVCLVFLIDLLTSAYLIRYRRLTISQIFNFWWKTAS